MAGGVVPFFDLGPGGLPLALAQGLAIAALFSAFGTLLFLGLLAPRAVDGGQKQPGLAEALRRCRCLAKLSLASALVLLLVWLGLETVVMDQATALSQAIPALAVVVATTNFGHLILGQCLLLAAAGLILFYPGPGPGLGLGPRPAAALAGAATALQAWHLHAAAMSDGLSLLLIVEILHVLAAAAWLGTLVPLALFVGLAPPVTGAAACRRYLWFGSACVLVLAVTACWQGMILIGGWHALIASAYGWMALVKLALFAILIGFAWYNHFRLAPPLLGADPAAAGRTLARNILREAVAGLLILLAAAVLASLPPGMDMTMQGRANPGTIAPAAVAVSVLIAPEFPGSALKPAGR